MWRSVRARRRVACLSPVAVEEEVVGTEVVVVHRWVVVVVSPSHPVVAHLLLLLLHRLLRWHPHPWLRLRLVPGRVERTSCSPCTTMMRRTRENCPSVLVSPSLSLLGMSLAGGSVRQRRVRLVLLP